MIKNKNIECIIHGHCYVAVPANSIEDMFCTVYECERCGNRVTV